MPVVSSESGPSVDTCSATSRLLRFRNRINSHICRCQKLHVPVVSSESGPSVETCCGMQGAGFRLQGAGWRVQGGGWRAEGSVCRVQCAGCRGQGSGSKVQVSGSRVKGSRCKVQGAGFKVQGAGCRVQGSGFRVQGNEEPERRTRVKNRVPHDPQRTHTKVVRSNSGPTHAAGYKVFVFRAIAVIVGRVSI